MKKLLTLLAASAVLMTACGNEQADVTKKSTSSSHQSKSSVAVSSSAANSKIPDSVKKKLKIALVMEFSIGTFSSQYIEGVKKQVEKFGGEVQVYNADNDLSKMASNLDTAINSKVDGILIDHGRKEALEAGVKKAIAAGIPVVSFDNDVNLPGVTLIDQDDYILAWDSLKKLAEDLNGKGNIATIWVGGFTPMERRKVMIDAFYKRYPGIKEVARFGNATSNTMLDTQTQVEALLKKYPKGTLNAIFATWDEFAKGATKAIEQAGRTDVKVYGIDLSDEDLQLIQENNSPWVATAAIDPAEIGEVQSRFLYQKIAGETTPDIYSLEPKLVEKDELPSSPIKISDLSKISKNWIPSTAATSPWMEKLEKENK
ncbi:sugar ABC transporter substrate-binding protein [Bacillus sp. RG28]|uniref:Sugar ABC transporter substrate-binding protein n=1 Tax=Gottfriedia endophytica TaxID=2820819 RepID=A0A940SH95_9BACI|nr:sugar ABC transporter substrate-binding protein [Gottfriedia endophytica]MBP0725957.1 sugar ABC transporter substrate-binding protein [Gottfriedia endophytica]